MATRKTSAKKAPANLPSQNRNRSISLSEIESYEREEVKKAYIPELDGVITYKNTSASGVLKVYSAQTISDQLISMAEFLAKSLCDEDGNSLYSSGGDILDKLSKEAIELIAVGIAQARQEERDNNEKKGKNDSRR